MRSEWPSFFGWYAVVVWTFASTIHRTVCPGSTQTPMGSNQTSEPSTSLFMWISATRAPRASRATARPASVSPPAAKNLRRVSTELLEQRLLVCRDVPENDVTLTVPGVYDYFCQPHEAAGMVGRIVVGKPGGPGAMAFDYFRGRPGTENWKAVPPAAQKAFPSVDAIMRRRIVRRTRGAS